MRMNIQMKNITMVNTRNWNMQIVSIVSIILHLLWDIMILGLILGMDMVVLD